jgi:cytochrome c biogenesis protein CcmG, thiol:disulfide interchange protein DsbE
MKETTRHWISSLIILILSAGWIWMSQADPQGTASGRIQAPQKGFLAPDFTLASLSGDMITLSDYRGRPVLINLWTSWCPPCRAEMPAMQRVYDVYQEQGFEILAVNATQQDNLQDVIAFVEEYDLSFQILLDSSGEVSRMYRLRSLPTSFFVDGNGIIQEVVFGGPMAEALLRVRVEQLLEGDS